jgi:hypothetical protein
MVAIRAERDTSRLGRYRLLAELGQGGMAKVSLAVVQGPGGFNKLVVVKQIHEQYAKEPEFVTMFLDEARLAARLQHPNVVQTNEVGEDDGRYFMTMEYLQGQTLGRIRARLGPKGLPLSMHIQVLIDVLAGLHYAHELTDYDRTPLNVVHRDATPENVFVTFDGGVKVVDFGIAKARDQVTETVVGTIKGKITYMAPEHARGDVLDRRADVFAVGVMLWEAATGQRMWRGVNHATILERLVALSIPSPRNVAPDIPGPLAAIISKALAPERDDRYATAAEFQTDLDLFLEGLGGRVPSRELGQLIARHFEAERAEVHALVQERLRDAQEPAPPEGYSTTGSPSAFAKGVTLTRTRAFVWRSALALGIAGTALALGGAAVLHARSAAPGTLAPLAQAPSASAAVPSSVTLRVSAAPREAQIFLDDRPLGSNPFTGALPADDADHRLRIEAPGYLTRIEPLTLRGPRELTVTLQQDHEPPAPQASAGPAKPERPVLGSRWRRRLDDANPYASPP